MVRVSVFITLLAGLSACAGGSQYSSQRAVKAPVNYIAVTPGAKPVGVQQPAAPAFGFATGPIYDACRGAGRESASRQRCGCVQWVADKELTASQQRRGAGYFDNQAELQEVRQSDAARNEAFWTAWKAYGEQAKQICSRS